jgi:CRISPR-associated protein Csx14
VSESFVPVDVFNPGQVFACVGLLEAADPLCGPAEGGFDWSEPAVRFRLRVPGEADPVATVLAFLDGAAVTTEAPATSPHSTAAWKVATTMLPAEAPFPFPDPASPATLPAVVEKDGRRLVIDHWGDATERDNVKFWAGAAGYPGAGLLRDALDAVKGRVDPKDPFSVSAPQSSSFRFDWRRDYVPIDAGFSLNEHGKLAPRGYPLVEVLAAIGLANARPARVHKLQYRYGVVGRARPTDPVFLPLPFVRAALGGAPLPFPSRRFRMDLDWPGQENQARCITTVSEESA